MKETVLYPTVKKALIECAVTADKIPGTTYSQGLPDFIGTYRGMSVHLEVKLKKLKNSWELTELQREHLIRHEKAGAICAVLTYQIEGKIWRLDTLDGVPETMQMVATGHGNLAKLLALWLEETRRKRLGLS